MKKAKKSSVYVIEDHPLVVEGIKELVNAQPDLCLRGHSPEWPAALNDLEKQKSDIVLLDISLKNCSGLEVLKNLKVHFPQLRVLMLSMHEETLYAMRTLKAGAQGYVMKAEATEQLVTAIRSILRGEIYLSKRIIAQNMTRLVGRRRADGSSALDDLSDRELEVFQMIGDGLTTRQIADKLQRSIKTVETHRQHLKEKLNLLNSTELVQHAIHWRS